MSGEHSWRTYYETHEKHGGRESAMDWMERTLDSKHREIGDLKKRLRKAKEIIRWLATESK